MTGDTMKKSLTEQVVQMVVGYFVGVGMNYLILPPFGVTHIEALWGISLIFTGVSYFRGLLVRRVFNRLPHDWTLKRLFKYAS